MTGRRGRASCGRARAAARLALIVDRSALAPCALATLSSNLAWTRYAASLGPLDLAASREGSALVVDRNGRLLRPFTMADGRWRLPATTHDVDPRYVAMLIAYEDGRFYAHHGVDGRALLRAAGQWLVRGHIVSGGSTLSMQVARLIEPRAERTLPAKLRQIARAEAIERAVGKAGVLDRYLTLAPFGGNLEGVRAASLAYFGKEPAEAHDRRGGAAGRFAAVARSAKAGSLSGRGARGARPRARPGRRPRRDQPRGGGEGEGRSGSRDAQSLPGARGSCGRRGRRRRPQGEAHPALDRRAPAGEARGARQGERRAARPKAVGGDRRRRQPQRRDPRPRRRGRPRRRLARGRNRHVARAALAGFGAEALHLRARLRGGPRASGDGAVRPAGALRGLRAAEFRPRLSGHGDGAQGAADVVEPAGDRAARRRRAGDVSRPPARRGRGDRAAEGHADRARDRPRRPRRFADRPRPPLRRLCPRRRGAGAGRAARRRGPDHRSAPGHRSGRGLVCRRHSAWEPAAGECAVGPHRLQDRHVLRLSRRAGGRLRPLRRRSPSGSGGPTTARRRGSSAGRPRRRSCSTPSPASGATSRSSGSRRASCRRG